MAAKDYTAAVESYTSAIKLNPSNPVYYSNRAAAYSQMSKHDLAISDAKKASELDPSFSKAYSRLGHALFCEGRFSEAVEAYEKGLELDPQNQSMKNSLATAKSRVQEDSDDDDGDAREVDAGGAAGGNPMANLANMMGGGGRGGGVRSRNHVSNYAYLLIIQMPDFASMMNNVRYHYTLL